MGSPEQQSLPFVSTGSLPPHQVTEQIVVEAHARFDLENTGALSTVYPALASANPDHFGISLLSTVGTSVNVGDVDVEFPIMSVVKPFVFALAANAHGAEMMRERVGVNSTGLPFNSLEAIERSKDGRTNPMVNPGAIAATSLVPGGDVEAQWDFVVDGLSRFAGRQLEIMADVYSSAMESNFRNRVIVDSLEERGRVYVASVDALDVYTRACSLAVTARDLAAMGATLAFGGVNPLSNVHVVAPRTCHATLAVMVTAGLYETSGDWLYETGLPGKSGVGGGIVTVAPGKGGMGTYAPLLDSVGNSVKGQLVAAHLSRELGLDLFAS